MDTSKSMIVLVVTASNAKLRSIQARQRGSMGVIVVMG